MLPTHNFFDKALLTDFENRLSSVDIENLPIAPYCRSYLRYIIGHKKYYCRIYVHLLSCALQHSGKAKDDICLLDYGAGNGLLGIFAKFCGFNKVYINDITPDFLAAAKKLATALSIPIDGFIEGDINDVQTYFSSGKPTVIVGSDVIEHIYDLNIFFTTIREINPGMITVFSTASNPFNWLKVRQLKKLQIQNELYGGSPGDDALFGEMPEPSYFSTRKKIIHDHSAGTLDEATVNKLATLTRGLIKADIERIVDDYTSSKIFPNGLNHPTNTCDPITGSWSERLLTLREYEMIYAAAGFEIISYSGFYNQYQTSVKNRLMMLMNKLIPLTGHRLAPFITLAGKPATVIK